MEAERQTIWFRDWVKLPDYATQKTDETGDADIARGLILRELQREAEGRLPTATSELTILTAAGITKACPLVTSGMMQRLIGSDLQHAG